MTKRPFLLVSMLAVAGAAAGIVAAGTGRNDLTPEDLARVKAITRPTTDFSQPEKFEIMQGGAATVRKARDANGLSHPSANLSFEGQQEFALGNGLFRKEWVSAPSSTQASDGLGPLFNARGCQSCHIKDGRGHAPVEAGSDATSLLVRISVAPSEEQAKAIASGALVAVPDPTYGLQIQDFAVAGLPAEGKVEIDYEEISVTLAGGETVSIRKPTLKITNPGFGPLADGAMLSARIAPAMGGLGLLEAIHLADILAHADPDDADGDGISGRASMVSDGAGGTTLGRFGWKAIEPSVERQSAHAFAGDMGLSTPVANDHWGDCTEAQAPCRAMPHGAQARLGHEEVPGELLDLVVRYSTNLALPARTNAQEPEVLEGKRVFYEAGCGSCHVPKFVTRRDAKHPEHRFQLIWPYTDLLLHDMGDGLADGRPEGQAGPREWRTPPLWGIGAAQVVSEEAGFLHDGRARNLMEAVLWHGGEAQAARDVVAASSKAERDALVRFLESL